MAPHHNKRGVQTSTRLNKTGGNDDENWDRSIHLQTYSPTDADGHDNDDDGEDEDDGEDGEDEDEDGEDDDEDDEDDEDDDTGKCFNTAVATVPEHRKRRKSSWREGQPTGRRGATSHGRTRFAS